MKCQLPVIYTHRFWQHTSSLTLLNVNMNRHKLAPSIFVVHRIKNVLLISGSELQGTVQEVENLRKEVENLKHSGETD